MTCSRPIRWTNGNRRPSSPKCAATIIFARGSSDDKGQVYIQIKAVEGLLKTRGKLPVNVKFLIEGEEETGGEHIEGYVEIEAAAPAGGRRRDLRYRNVRARTAHYLRRSARHGVLRAARGRRQPRSAFGRLRRRRAQPHSGHRRNYLRAERPRRPHPDPGLLRSRACRPAAKEREAWARLPFDENEYTEKEMGARELVGEPGVPLFERVWARPTFEVHGIRGGFTGEGAKTVIPARAMAKISTRLVADQRPEEAAAQLRKPRCARPAQGRHRGIEGAAHRRAVADQPGQRVHPRRRRSHEASVRQGHGLHPLGRIHPHRRRVRRVPRHSQRDDGLRAARRQSARPQRETPPAEFLSRASKPLPAIWKFWVGVSC